MSYKEFNFARAWRETAMPLFVELPDNIKALYERVVREGLPQKRDLDCAWPEQDDYDRLFNIATRNDWSGPLREAFEEIDTLTLSKAASIIHDFGHWRPINAEGPPSDRVGGTWKFANYADQILRSRFPRAKQSHNGTSSVGLGLEIHEGVFRITYASRDCWMWREVGYCDDANYAAIVEFLYSSPCGERDFDKVVGKFRDEMSPDDGTPLMNLLRAGEKYSEGKVIVCKTCKTTRPAQYGKSEWYDAVYESEAKR